MPRTRRSTGQLPSDVLPHELQRARERIGLTQQQLADRLDGLGAPMDRTVVAKVEARKRGVSIDELFAFAAALGVSPASLVVPRSADKVRVTPSLEVDVQAALQWIRNTLPLAVGDKSPNERVFFEAVPDREAAAYRRSANLRAIVKATATLLMVSGWDESFRSKALGLCLRNLAKLVQREWDDNGLPGSASQAARAYDKAVEKAIEKVIVEMEAQG